MPSPDERVPTSLHLVEEFFGAPLDQEHLLLAQQMPLEQMFVLAERLNDYRHIVEGDLNDIVGENSKFIHANDVVSLEGGRQRPVSEIPELKYLLLLCEQSIIPDNLLDWALGLTVQAGLGPPYYGLERQAQRDLVEALRQVLPIKDSIRSRALIPVPTAFNYAPKGSIYPPPIQKAAYGDPSFLSEDPYLKFLLHEKLGFSKLHLNLVYTTDELRQIVEEEIETHPSWREVIPRLAEAWGGCSTKDLVHSSQFTTLCREAKLAPLTTNPTVRTHMSRVTALNFDQTNKRNAPEQLAEDVKTGSAIFTFPLLGDVSIKEIQVLRANEEIFQEVRLSFNALHHTMSGLAERAQGDYLRFAHEVRTAADDIVRPTYEKMHRQQKAAKTRSLIMSWSGGALVALALQGLTLVVPPASHAGPIASNAARQLISRRSRRKVQQLELASSLLLSVLPAEAASR